MGSGIPTHMNDVYRAKEVFIMNIDNVFLIFLKSGRHALYLRTMSRNELA